jgi:uncharacterized protein
MNYDDLQKEYIKAFKNKETIKASVYSMLKSSIKYKEIDLRATNSSITENDILDIIKSEVKKHNESIELYKKGNRPELANKEEEELKILRELLPAEMSKEEIEAIVLKYVTKLQANSLADFGKVMREVSRELKGKANGLTIKEVVEEQLNNLNKHD